MAGFSKIKEKLIYQNQIDLVHTGIAIGDMLLDANQQHSDTMPYFVNQKLQRQKLKWDRSTHSWHKETLKVGRRAWGMATAFESIKFKYLNLTEVLIFWNGK